ncbi:hypothetical protein WH47_04310 [Habropoda laboriosa]|uniref:Uncharacterized protein n=1 Tax=Habropoda laboriosa TaxID=597456 RepID=A0A0L7QQY9_9HYME|nr:hypothetical protein WH47_04310 [Habropoda laboriosa]
MDERRGKVGVLSWHTLCTSCPSCNRQRRNYQVERSRENTVRRRRRGEGGGQRSFEGPRKEVTGEGDERF